MTVADAEPELHLPDASRTFLAEQLGVPEDNGALQAAIIDRFRVDEIGDQVARLFFNANEPHTQASSDDIEGFVYGTLLKHESETNPL